MESQDSQVRTTNQQLQTTTQQLQSSNRQLQTKTDEELKQIQAQVARRADAIANLPASDARAMTEYLKHSH